MVKALRQNKRAGWLRSPGILVPGAPDTALRLVVCSLRSMSDLADLIACESGKTAPIRCFVLTSRLQAKPLIENQ